MSNKRETYMHGHVTGTKAVQRDGVNIGIIEGYIATWDLDRGDWRYRDQFKRGCWAESIAEYKANKRMPRFKDSHGRTVGGWQYDSLIEDSTGLFGVAEVNIDVQQGAELYSLAKQKVITDFSVGFQAEEFQIDETGKIRTITRAKLWEGSAVDEPMNPKANITAVKAAIEDLPSDLSQLLVYTGMALGVFAKNGRGLIGELKEVINERFKKENRAEVIEGDTLVIDRVSVKELTERQLESIISSKNAMLTKHASKTLISYLNFQDMRDAVKEKDRDGQKDDGIKARLDKLKQLLEAN